MNFLIRRDDKFKKTLVSEEKSFLINDRNYWSFIKKYGDGYYFDQSLHFYGKSDRRKNHDLLYRTNMIKDLYRNISIENEIICFGEDVFGNQHIFYSEGVGLFIIETGEIEFVSDNFKGWLSKLEVDLDYYTGESLKKTWTKYNEHLSYEEVLTPKVPFVLGGKYEIDNLYKSDIKTVISFNANLAFQIENLGDGETIQIEIN